MCVCGVPLAAAVAGVGVGTFEPTLVAHSFQ